MYRRLISKRTLRAKLAGDFTMPCQLVLLLIYMQARGLSVVVGYREVQIPSTSWAITSSPNDVASRFFRMPRAGIGMAHRESGGNLARILLVINWYSSYTYGAGDNHTLQKCIKDSFRQPSSLIDQSHVPALYLIFRTSKWWNQDYIYVWEMNQPMTHSVVCCGVEGRNNRPLLILHWLEMPAFKLYQEKPRYYRTPL